MKQLKIEEPEIIKKGWGQEVIFENNIEFSGKLLVFQKQGQASTHFHLNKNETWYLLQGEINITTFNPETGQKEIINMKPGKCVKIKAGTVHGVYAVDYSVILEVGNYFDENDTYRIAPGDSQL